MIVASTSLNVNAMGLLNGCIVVGRHLPAGGGERVHPARLPGCSHRAAPSSMNDRAATSIVPRSRVLNARRGAAVRRESIRPRSASRRRCLLTSDRRERRATKPIERCVTDRDMDRVTRHGRGDQHVAQRCLRNDDRQNADDQQHGSPAASGVYLIPPARWRPTGAATARARRAGERQEASACRGSGFVHVRPNMPRMIGRYADGPRAGNDREKC